MDRLSYRQQIDELFEVFPVVALLGPRQCGKTTLARQYAGVVGDLDPGSSFDLEDDVSVARLSSPFAALGNLRGLVVIDEIQRVPELFRTLRVLVDREANDARFLVLGSASPELIQQSSETLAGRIAYLELTPFQLHEVGKDSWRDLWIRGGFPRSFLARTERASVTWREQYLRTYVERDLPLLGANLTPAQTRQFWTMLAHYHGQTWNAAEIAQAMSMNVRQVNRMLDILEGAFMVRRLLPWFENVGKRQVKAPKLYLRDSGLFHRLLGLDSEAQVQHHPKLGASWEGFALESLIQSLDVPPEACFYWRTHSGAELDLLVFRDGRRLGFEVKYGDAPRLTRSMGSALQTLHLDELNVIYPGSEAYSLADHVHVRPLSLI